MKSNQNYKCERERERERERETTCDEKLKNTTTKHMNLK